MIGAGLIILTPACGSNGGAANGEASGDARTIEHKYGSTEVSGSPNRIVTVGYSDHDAVLALGVKPVGVRQFIGERAIWPWAEEALGSATPETLPSAELDFEQVAALEPDLIVGVNSQLTEEEYETLSEISPAIAQSGEYPDLATPWQEQTRTIGRALGQENQAEKLVGEVEAHIDEVREQHPEFEGSTLALGYLTPDGYGLYGPRDFRIQTLTTLGFEVPAGITDLVGEKSFTAVNRERLDLADTDVLVWQMDSASQRKTLENDPLYRRLDVYSEGRDLFLVGDDPLRVALGLGSVLSIPFVLDELVPQIAAAVDGDPETAATE